MKPQTRFIPAMHFRWLTPYFDVLTNWTLPDRELKERLIEQAGIQPQHKVLDRSIASWICAAAPPRSP